MLGNDGYLESDPLEERRRFWRVLDECNATGADDDDKRWESLSGLFGHIGGGSVVLPRFQCSYGTHISLGNRVFVNLDAIFMDDASITVTDDVRVGPRVQLLVALHPLEDHERRRAGWERPLPIVIGEDAWLGGGVIVCPGVTIGANSIVVLRVVSDHRTNPELAETCSVRLSGAH